LKRAASRATATVVAIVGAVAAMHAHESKLALLLLLLSGVLAFASRQALQLAARSRVGAVSESHVRRVLKQPERRGWSIRHAVDWPGRGDLDHVLRSPSGMGFVIETKTLRYTRAHLARTVDSARWLARRRCRYPAGVCPVTASHAPEGTRVAVGEEVALGFPADRCGDSPTIRRPSVPNREPRHRDASGQWRSGTSTA